MPSSEVMHKWGKGTLRSGGSGKKVTSQKQAVAIMLSERRNEQKHGGTYTSKTDRGKHVEVGPSKRLRKKHHV